MLLVIQSRTYMLDRSVEISVVHHINTLSTLRQAMGMSTCISVALPAIHWAVNVIAATPEYADHGDRWYGRVSPPTRGNIDSN
jgi:hypothetical protein